MESLPKAWLGNIEAVRDAVDKFGLSRKELVRVVELTVEGLRRGRFRSVTNWLTLGLVADPQRFSNHLKRKGVLRSSRYNYKTSILVASIKAQIASPGISNLPDDVERYLKSSLALAKLAPSVEVINLGLIQCIRRESKTYSD